MKKGPSEKKCGRCGGKNHTSERCKYKETICHTCNKKGHLARACRNTKEVKQKPSYLKSVRRVNQLKAVPPIQQPLVLNGQTFNFEVDTGAGENFMSTTVWRQIGSPTMKPNTNKYVSASGDHLGVRGSVEIYTTTKDASANLTFVIVKRPDLNLLGRTAIKTLGISVDSIMQKSVFQINSTQGSLERNVRKSVRSSLNCSRRD